MAFYLSFRHFFSYATPKGNDGGKEIKGERRKKPGKIEKEKDKEKIGKEKERDRKEK